MTEELSIRKAQLRDADVIANFSSAMALETEGKALIPERIAAGVRRLLTDGSLGFYAVAERDGKVVGCLMITNEWSDWRNGLFWWIESVYVDPGVGGKACTDASTITPRAGAGRSGCVRVLYVE